MTDTGCKEKRNWSAWHDQYEDKSSPLIHRLSVVQREIRRALPRQLNRSFSIISICAGQGNDVIPVLGEYGHVQLVRARLVEVDPSSIGKLRDKINAAGLNHLEVMQADAAPIMPYWINSNMDSQPPCSRHYANHSAVVPRERFRRDYILRTRWRVIHCRHAGIQRPASPTAKWKAFHFSRVGGDGRVQEA
jgi:hypothetical protein